MVKIIFLFWMSIKKQINESMIDREKNGSPKIAKDEYFNIISYDLNAAGFPSKKTELYQLLGKKKSIEAHTISISIMQITRIIYL